MFGASRQSLNLANAVAVSWPINRYGGETQVTGAAVLNTTNRKFGTASGNFTSGGSLTYKQFDADAFATSGNYTIEGWIMLPEAVTGQKSLFTVAGAGSVSLRPQGGNVYDIEYTFEGENWNTNGGAAQTFTYGTWYHFAICRYTVGPTTNIFFNGTRRSNRTATHTRPFGTGTSVDFLINGGQNLIYIDEIRLSNISRYVNTTTYTIPTAAFSNDANTRLLMHFDGTNGSNQFTDDGALLARTVRTITTQTGATVSTTQSKFGGASLAVSVASQVTTARLTLSADSDFAFGNNNFTYECWIYPTTLNGTGTTTHYFIDFRSSTTDSNNLGIHADSSGRVTVSGLNISALITSATSVVAINNWYHVAVTRSGTTVTLWVNGTSRGTATSSATVAITGRTPTVGRGAVTTTQTFRGYIDEVRISNSARYTGTFTPSATALTNDANTVFLMHADGANGSTTFTDDNS